MLTVLETVEAEHPRGLHYWRRCRLSLLFVYFAAVCARWGNEPKGPTYADRDLLAGFREDQARRARAAREASATQ